MGKDVAIVNCAQANQIDLVTFLEECGYTPARIRGENYWYLSPIRDEKTPSFKIDRRLNRWYDHGIGRGGKLVDLGILLFGCGVAELLVKLNGSFSFHKPAQHSLSKAIIPPEIIIKEVLPISSVALIQYLELRKINLECAAPYCCEVHYSVDSKTYYALGFANDAGGYELRSKNFKGSSSPKDLRHIKSGAEQVAVFEGFFDFLSFLTYLQNQQLGMDYLILNSLSFFEKAIPLLSPYQQKHLYLDRDKSGQNCSRKAQALNDHYFDDSSLYNGCKDFNDFLVKTAGNDQ